MDAHMAIKIGNLAVIEERIKTRQIHVNYQFEGLT